MSFNVSQYVKAAEQAARGQSSGYAQPAAYQSEAGINLSAMERARQSAATEAARRLEQENSTRVTAPKKSSALQKAWDALGKPFDALWKDNTIRTNDERDQLIAELKRIQNANSISMTRRRDEIRQRLAELDMQLGNGEMSYGIDRLADTVTGGVKGWAGEQATFFGKGAELLSRIGEKLGSNTSDYAGWATDEMSAAQIGNENDSTKRLQELAEAKAMQDTGRRWSETGDSEVERAKNGLGQLGRLGVDLGANAVQMGLDAGTAALTGGSGALVPLFTRASGGGMREAEAAGADLKHQLLYGSTVGVVEVATEMLTGGLAKFYGAGSADELVERAVRKMTTSEVGRRALLTLSDMAGEGVEEIISNIVNPYAKALYDGGEALKKKFGSVEGFKEAVSEELYDGLVGALMGGFGSVTKTVSGDTARTVQRMDYADQAEGSLRSQWGTDMAGRRASSEYAQLIARQMMGEDLNQADQARFNARPTAVGVLEGMQNQQYEDFRQTEEGRSYEQKAVKSWIDDVFSGENLSEDQKNILAEGVGIGTASMEEYAAGVHNAYNLGKTKVTLEQARQAANENGQKLNDVQFQHAYQMGYSAAAETADTTTEEGRTTVVSNLRALGSRAERAAETYQAGQDVGSFSNAMINAVEYAATGADLKAITQTARQGGSLSWTGHLTEAQVQRAEELGRELQEERKQNTKKRVAQLAGIQEEAAKIRKEQNPDAVTIGATIRDTQNFIAASQEEVSGIMQGLKIARQAQPEIVDTAEYKERMAQADAMRVQIREAKKAQNELRAKRQAARKSQGRQKGRAIYESKAGEAGGLKYRAVNRASLSRTQKAAARVAEAIADATGLEIHIVDFGKGFGGEYFPGTGGKLYLNINAAFDGKNFSIMSLSHELTHWLQEYAPEQYAELKQIVLAEMQRNPERYESIFQERKGRQTGLTSAQITDEMVANACQTVLLDTDAIQRIVNEHRTLAERILDFILQLVDDIREAFGEVDLSTDRSIFREMHAVEDTIEQVRDLWLDAFETATENLQAQKTVSASKNTATEGGEVQYQVAEREEILHLQDQIRENMWRFEGKPALATVNSEIAFNENNIGEAVSWIAEKIGAPVTIQRKGFGQVTFTKKRINQGFNYMPGKKGSKGRNAIGQALTTACVAAPEVVINGVQIGHHSDHKGTGVQTWTFAGPVEIDGERGIMAVVVRKTNQNYYKVHRILTPSGDIMVLDNNKAEVSGGGSPENRTLAQPKLSAEDSIADAEETVKGERQLQAWDAAESEQEERQIQRVQYSVFEEDPETLAWLNKQEKDGDVVHTYKSFLEIDGKLYPPMASMKKGPDGKWKMAKAMEVGRWEKSVGDPSKIEVDPKNGRGYFTLKKDDGSTVKAAYNPYQHSSNLMINDQFTGAYSRPGLVTYECIIPKSELTSGYRAEYAKDAVGVHSWKAGPVAGKLIKAKGTERQVYLSRWLKPVRRVPDAEVAQHYKELLDGTDIAVPSNVVPPSLLHALEDAGVKIEYDPRAPKAQFQMISEVEETDRLVAVHNKSVSGLRRMLKRGGVPFPSIAIKRAGTAHQGFGDVSIVFPKSTIDPEVNRQNRLYSNDAWTPTEPRTEYEVDIPYKIKQRIEESVGSDLFTALNGYSYLDDGDVARALENSTGNLFEAMKGRRILKYAYLKSIGKEPEITQKEADLDGSHKYKNEQLLRIFEQIPTDEIENANWDSDDTLKKIADVLNEQFLEKIQDPEKRERIRNSEKLMPYSADKISIGYIKSALFKYRQNGNRAGTEIDTYELDRVLRDNTEVERDPGYKAWIEKTFGKVIKNEGIPNGKDPYTSSGNRRSFKQTHVPATLENIVAQMQKEQERGIGLGGINLRGAATRTYKTVEEMRADRGRLLGERVSDDVYDSYMKGFYSRLHDMSDRVKSGSSISAYDSAEQILLEVLRDSTSKAQMGRKLQAEGRWIRLYDGLTDELWQLKQDVQNMPAPYFEAKPRRVVYPEEALAYIIPDSSEAADVREMLEEDGRYKVLTYKAGDESDRLRVLNSVEGAQFQRYDEQLEGQMAFFDVENSNMHPMMRGRIEEATQLTEDIKAYFGSIPEGPLSAEDIEGMMDFDAFNQDAIGGDMLDPAAIVDELLETAKAGGEHRRRQAYRLAERMLGHMSAFARQTYVDDGNTGRVQVQDRAFADWYNARHPSLYYPGYQPGDLFEHKYNKGGKADEIQKEKDYLHGLLESGNLMEPELSEARELLDRLNNPQPKEVFYQQYDDTYEDTEAESNERALAYTRLQNENAMLIDIIDKMSAVVKGKDKTIEKILKKLARSRRSDAEKLAKQLVKEYSSKADLSEVTAAIKEVGDYFVQTPTESLNPEQAKELARKAAGLIAGNAEDVLEETRDEVYGQIRDSIKGRKLSIRPEYAGELDQYGGYNAFKKENAGNFTLTRADRVKNADEFISVDQFYQDLNRTFGDAYFPEAGSDNGPVNEGEMVKIIADAFEAGEPITVNPFEAYMGEATEMIANTIAFRVLNDNVLKPLLPAEAEKAFDQLKAANGENAELRKALDLATTRGEVMKEELERLQKEGRLSKKELVELRDEVYELTNALKKADQECTALQEQAEQRLQQVKEEGRARVTEVKARERERAAKQISELKKHYQELQKKARERREESAGTTKYRKQVQAKATALYEMLMKNDDKKHVPEVLKRPVAEFLESIDFTSKRQLRGGDETNADREFGARMRALERALSGQQDYIDGTGNVQEDLGGYVDISQENLQFLRDTIGLIDTALKENRDYTINQMSAAELKQLSNFLSNLNTAIRNLNSFMANARFESVREAADQDIESLKKLGKPGKFAGSAVDKFAAWENGTPYYIMKRFGEGGKSIFDGFAKGWERMAFNAKEIIDFTKKLYTDKEVNTWKNEIRDIELSDGSKVRMTTAQIMELSMLLNREQALKHIEAGGIRIGDITEKGRTIHDTTHYHLTMQDIVNITGMLNARQRDVAKALQTYMARKGSEWGNEVSIRRFGYEFYTEGENYYPIKTDANDRPMADTDAQTNSMFRLLNLSSSKSLNPKASNALVVGNIFDTFADHMADMAKLNGMGLPILDAIKWFNFKERINYNDGTYDTRTMQGAMEQAYGTQALKYFRTLMKDINGMTESGDRGVSLPGKLMSNYKIASVGANLRVALLQPTSYVRAMTVLKPQFLAGVLPSMEAYREAMKYSGTAVWKSLGYYDTDIARGMRGQIQHDDTIRDKIASASMTLAEKGDQLTWSRLWTACKRQAKSENGNLRGQALMDRTAALFREVVYSSQVMDSTLTRSEVMRGKTNWTKAMSAFMAEPTLSYNILLDAASEYMNDTRRNGKAGAWQRNAGKIGKAFTVYVCSAAFSAVVESIADAARDDDDEKFLDKWLEAFLGEDSLIQGNLAQDMTILGKLPYIKSFISTLQGYSSSDMSTAAFSNLVNVFKIWEETIKLNNGTLDKATKITYYGRMTEWGKVYKTLQALSQLSGVAASNMTRDVTAIWNLTVGSINPDMKIRTYDSNALSESKEAAYQETVKPTGIKKSQYKNILTQADEDGNGSVKQAEMDAYLKGAVQNGELSREQAAAIWDAQGWKKSWAEYGKQETGTTTTTTKKTSTASTARTSSTPSGQIEGWDDFKTVAPIYGGPKREATYNAKPANMSLTEYTKMLQAADADGNKSLKQDELGFALKAAVQGGQMSWEAAMAVWAAQGWSHDLSWWAAKHP